MGMRVADIERRNTRKYIKVESPRKVWTETEYSNYFKGDVPGTPLTITGLTKRRPLGRIQGRWILCGIWRYTADPSQVCKQDQ